jgi:hypothetical protein
MADSEQSEVNDFFDEPAETALTTAPENQVALPGKMGEIQSFANVLSKSTIIPATYQNKPENCIVAIEFAQRIGCNAMMVMQNLDIIQGKPSWSSKFMTAVANECGRFSPVRYKMTGTKGQDDWGCIAYFKELETGETLEGPEVTIQMAKDEGWYQKKGSKRQTIPELMLHYRAAAFLIRTYAPELTMGLHTADERQDMINVTPGREEETAAERAWRLQNEG